MSKPTFTSLRLFSAQRLALSAVLAVTALFGTTLATSGTALASATGCARWGSVHIPGFGSIPTGQYCFSINGSGTRVNYTSGSIDTPVIYNFAEDVRFYDGRGNNYYTYWGPTHWGAAYGPHSWWTSINGTAQRGSVCGELTSNSVIVTRVCESIF